MTVWSLAGAAPVDRRQAAECTRLPAPLFEFYSHWEPASECKPVWICEDLDKADPAVAGEFNVRLHPLDKVSVGRLADHAELVNLGEWGRCDAVCFAASSFAGEHIVYIEKPPGGHPGRVFAVGPSVPRVGDLHVYCLAESFQEWMSRVMQFQGVDLFLIPGSISEMVPPETARRLRDRMIELNPDLEGHL